MSTPKPMLSKSQDELPTQDGWRYEPKWDGFRTIATRDRAGSVTLSSRNDRPLGRYFPEIVRLLEAQPQAAYVIDGEIVMVANGEMDFDTLQLRLHPAASRVNKLAAAIPATLVAFDVLEVDGRDVRSLDTDARREELTRLIDRLGGEPAPAGPDGLRPGPTLVLTPRSDDLEVATAWFEDVAGFGQDGIVAKRADGPYVEGERVMVKVKHRRTADCVVGGYRKERKGDGVGSLLLGLYDDDGRLHYVGHTSAFKAKERRELREILAPLEGGSSFGGFDDQARAPGGPSRWSAGRDTEWVALEPKLVVEVRFERLQNGRFRHSASIVRWRPDRDPESCTFEQIGGSPPAWAAGTD
jgi:ATP-dependent DNA ligase